MGWKLNKSQSWMFTKYRNVSPDIEMKFPSKLLFIGLSFKITNYKAILL